VKEAHGFLSIEESITLHLNSKVKKLAQSGHKVFNLTSGQLNFRPPLDLISAIGKELNFLKSFQYAPNAGLEELREKFLLKKSKDRSLSLESTSYDCVISNGSKQSLFLTMKALLKPGDEVILLAPFWGTYFKLIELCGAKPIIVDSHLYNSFTASVEDIEEKITKKTKLIIVNSPNNPAGVHYSDDWMKSFAFLLEKNSNLYCISDEVYEGIIYFDPDPKYFYQFNKNLLKRTIIIDGISKSFAATGLRIGYAICSKELAQILTALQSQISSAPNTLIQSALIQYDFNTLEEFKVPIKNSIRACASILRDAYAQYNISHNWYQTTSGFYYFLDLSKFSFFARYNKKGDLSTQICDDILEKTGVALVPGTFFGKSNCARMSLTIEEEAFREAIELLFRFLES
jgi:aspartate aminotransferase